MTLGTLLVDFSSAETTDQQLLTEKEIVDSCVPLKSRDVTGVYFLKKGSEVVYVGQSMNVLKRIASHAESLDFDGFCYIRCNAGLLDTLESIYIHILRPRFNGNSSVGKRSPLPFSTLLSRISIKSPEQNSGFSNAESVFPELSEIHELMKITGVSVASCNGDLGIKTGQLRRWLNEDERPSKEQLDNLRSVVIGIAEEKGAIPEGIRNKPMSELIKIAQERRTLL